MALFRSVRCAIYAPSVHGLGLYTDRIGEHALPSSKYLLLQLCLFHRNFCPIISITERWTSFLALYLGQ